MVDHNGTITNENTIKYLYPNIPHNTLKQMATNKYNFNTTKTSLLYNNKTVGSERVRKVYDDRINASIIDFWINNTFASPNTCKYRLLKREDGITKYKQVHHFCHCKYKEMYSRWIEQ